MRRVLAGDTPAFRGLIQKYAGTVSGLVYHFTGRRDILDDVSQEVFFQAFRSLAKLREPASFGSWIYGITRRICLNWIRRHRSEPLSLDDALDQIEDVAMDRRGRPDCRAEDADLMRAVRSLPPIYREALVLRYFEELSYKEIAEIMRVSASAINVRLVKGRKILRERMTRMSRVRGVVGDEM